MSEFQLGIRRRPPTIFLLTLVLILFGFPFSRASAQSRTAANSSVSNAKLVAEARSDPQGLVQQTVQNEVKCEMDDSTHWRFRRVETKPSISKTWDVIETKRGEVQHLLAMDGHPLDAQQQQAEQQRMQQFLASRNAQIRKQKASSGDYNQEQKLMLMLPHALLFTYSGHDGDFVKLTFKPNPNFHASTHEAEVFHHMVGQLVVDVSNMRVAQFSGHIASRVNFGYGLLGHLDKGGTFDVQQQDISDGHWGMTLLDTKITGKALFFKTISVQEKIVEDDYRRVSDNLTLEQAANMLRNGTNQSLAQTKTSSRMQSSGSHRHN